MLYKWNVYIFCVCVVIYFGIADRAQNANRLTIVTTDDRTACYAFATICASYAVTDRTHANSVRACFNSSFFVSFFLFPTASSTSSSSSRSFSLQLLCFIWCVVNKMIWNESRHTTTSTHHLYTYIFVDTIHCSNHLKNVRAMCSFPFRRFIRIMCERR